MTPISFFFSVLLQFVASVTVLLAAILILPCLVAALLCWGFNTTLFGFHGVQFAMLSLGCFFHFRLWKYISPVFKAQDIKIQAYIQEHARNRKVRK